MVAKVEAAAGKPCLRDDLDAARSGCDDPEVETGNLPVGVRDEDEELRAGMEWCREGKKSFACGEVAGIVMLATGEDAATKCLSGSFFLNKPKASERGLSCSRS